MGSSASSKRTDSWCPDILKRLGRSPGACSKAQPGGVPPPPRDPPRPAVRAGNGWRSSTSSWRCSSTTSAFCDPSRQHPNVRRGGTVPHPPPHRPAARSACPLPRRRGVMTCARRSTARRGRRPRTWAGCGRTADSCGDVGGEDARLRRIACGRGRADRRVDVRRRAGRGVGPDGDPRGCRLSRRRPRGDPPWCDGNARRFSSDDRTMTISVSALRHLRDASCRTRHLSPLHATRKRWR